MPLGDYDLLSYVHDLPRFILRGQETTVYAPLMDENGDQWTPDSATYGLYLGYDNDLFTPAAMTITGGIPQYTVPAGTFSINDAREQTYQEVILATKDGVEHRFDRNVAAVRRVLYPVVDDNAVVRGNRLLSRMLEREGTFKDQRVEAWGKLLRRFLQQDRWPDLILDSYALRDAHIALTRHLIWRGTDPHMTDTGYPELAQEERENYEEEWARLRFTYDGDHDGNPSGGEEGTGSNHVVWIGGGQGATQGRSGGLW